LLVRAGQLVQLVNKVTSLILQLYMPMAVQLVVLVLGPAQRAAVVVQLDMLEQAVPVPMQQAIKVSKHLQLQEHILGLFQLA
jgi:hypothetical protein